MFFLNINLPYIGLKSFFLWVQVVMVLKKEIMKTQNKELEKAAEYRHLLVHAIHECAANFPDIAANVIHLLMDFLVRLCPGSVLRRQVSRLAQITPRPKA